MTDFNPQVIPLKKNRTLLWLNIINWIKNCIFLMGFFSFLERYMHSESEDITVAFMVLMYYSSSNIVKKDKGCWQYHSLEKNFFITHVVCFVILYEKSFVYFPLDNRTFFYIERERGEGERDRKKNYFTILEPIILSVCDWSIWVSLYILFLLIRHI